MSAALVDTWADGLDECESCGAMVFPSTSWPWHYPDEDCRAIKDPCSRSEWDSYTDRPHAEDRRFKIAQDVGGATNGAAGGGLDT